MANAWRICEEMGIQIVSRKNGWAGELQARQTRSRATIKEIAEAGEAIGYPEMVYDVLGLFLASEANACQLYGETIQGVARWVLAARLRTADIPFVRPAFAEIDLAMIREAVQHHRIQNRPPQIGLMVAGLMEEAVAAIDLRKHRKSA